MFYHVEAEGIVPVPSIDKMHVAVVKQTLRIEIVFMLFVRIKRTTPKRRLKTIKHSIFSEMSIDIGAFCHHKLLRSI